jgi:uncharacterized membrane protein YcaP (DUF421 family)
MDKSDIRLSDWQRILFGSAPAEFLVEVLIRTIVVYIVLLMVVRWLGKRMSGQLTITELSIAIMLGAIVAPPMETPERGIFQGVFILFLVLFFHQWLSLATVKNPRLEKVVDGELSIFVKDGILQLDAINHTHIARAQLFAVLREEHIYNLGKVKRLYMEACGVFSILEAKEAKPGLSLLPVADDAIHEMQKKPYPHLQACTSCGNVVNAPFKGQACGICGNSHWDTAVM